MVLRAMYSGVSGLRAEGEALGVVGDNIANVNTVGFKGQRAVFQDMLGQSIMAGQNSPMPGAGVKIGDVQQLFTQGSLSNTGVSTDVALAGDGFFVVQGNVEGVQGNFFTRAGQFALDKSGYLVTTNGLQVQGYAAQPNGTFAASTSSVRAPDQALSPKPTSSMEITANLDSGEELLTADWSADDPSATSHFSTSITTYDSLGNAHSLDVYFRRTADNAWDYHVLADGSELAAGTPGNIEVGSGSFSFTTNGALDSHTPSIPLGVDWAGATPGQAIALDFGRSIAEGGSGLEGITQFGSPSNTSSQTQNGYASGDLSGVAVDGSGVVFGLYSNGEKLPISQLAVAKFRSNDGLARAGQNMWIATRDSGPPAIGVAGSGGRGAITAGALEGSNVDLAEEFVNMIQHQRSFSANSKTITTANEMLQELINIKR